MKSDDCLYVGIDFSKYRIDFALLPADGPPLVYHKAFRKSYSGYQDAKEWLLKSLAENNLSHIKIAGEATSYYWLPLFMQFVTDHVWEPFHPEPSLVNPTWIHCFKKTKSFNGKSDCIDPAEIGYYLREYHPATWSFSPHWLSLRFYTRLRSHLVNSRTREKNLLNLFIFLLYSSYSSHKPFANYLGSTSKELLLHPDLMVRLSSLSLDDLATELDDLSNHRLPDPLKNASALQQVFADAFPQDPAIVSAYNNIVAILIDTISYFDSQIAHVEALITSLVSSGEYPQVEWLQTIPGVGFVLASGIAAEIGDIALFTQRLIWDKRRLVWRLRTSHEVLSAVAKFAGIWWPENSSGKFKAEDARMSRKGNPYLRYYVLEAADNMRQFIPAFRDYYSSKFDQANIHKHKRALVLTGSKCLDLFVTLLRRKEIYRPREVASA